MEKITKTKRLLYGITLLTALIILIDFTLPGKVFNEEVINIKREREKYHNAGGNSHYTYKAITSQHQFSVSEDFAKSVKNKAIKYSVSLIFTEINKYGLTASEESEIYSFRIASGFALPLVVIFSIIIAYCYKKNLDILLFVLQISLLANLIILML